MHRFHAPGVTEDEADVMLPAGVGEPVPAMHAFAGDEQPLAKGRDGMKEGFGSGGKIAGEANESIAVENDDEQVPGVQIDASIELGRGRWKVGTHGEGLL